MVLVEERDWRWVAREEKDWEWGWPIGVVGEEKPCYKWRGRFADLLEEEAKVCLVMGLNLSIRPR